VLIGGIMGGLTGYLLQYYVTVIYFPINIAGRPLHSWPMYIVITFELTILFAAISAVFRSAGAVRIAHAVSSGIQRAAIFAGYRAIVFLVH
jgi:ABC-type lipoprotein release transport system permease subunit